MNSEAQIILSFIFKRSGKYKLKESEIYLPLSIDLSWFNTNEAKKFVKYCLQQNLLVKNNGLLSPSFDIEKITIPFGFIPTKKEYTIEETEIKCENILETIVQKIIDTTGKNHDDLCEEIKQTAMEKNIVSDVAVLLVAQKYDIDISKCFDDIESLIFTENEG